MLSTVADREGMIVRDGVHIHWQLFGSGPRVLFLLPTWSIVHSDFWRHQVAHFRARYSVLTFDGRGNGASDRPTHSAAYADSEFAQDALAVLDAASIQQAAAVSASAGAAWGLLLAAGNAERVPVSVFIAPSLPLSPPLAERAPALAVFNDEIESSEGWFKFNRHYWRRDYPGFLEFFFAKCFTEPNSSEQIAHFVEMGLQTNAETLLLTVEAPSISTADAIRLAQSLGKHTLVIQGEADAITPPVRARELARLSRADLVMLPESGHEPQCRDPIRVNALIDSFLDRCWSTA